MRHLVRAVLLTALAVAMVVAGPPAGAHEDHGGPGASGPDSISRNVKPMSNVPASAPGVTQSDLAFRGDHAIAGNYRGFRIIDISEPGEPEVVTDFACNGAQSDVSVWGDLVFQSVDSPQSHGGCDSTNVTASTPGMFEGIRIFDISDTTAPVHLASIATACGSHTHTLLPKGDTAYIYVSSYPLGAAANGPNCQQPHNKVSIVEVPAGDPAAATVHEHQLDAGTELAVYPLGAAGTFSFRACHDMSVFAEVELLAAACLSESQLWDISDPLAPELLWRFDDPVVNTANIDLWHSSTFSWDGSIVAFGDESGGGGAARCVDPDDQQGRIWFLDTETGEVLANYKIPRSESGTCTMHNFNFVPLRGRNVLVSSAYTGGTTVVDVDKLIAGASEAEAEIGHYRPHGGSAWSSYWYNGFIYANDILRGVDTLLLSDPARAGDQKLPHLNPQTQENLIR
ncbi:MAG TPA: hypothetical protein VFZ77_04725 [Acidimicrobiales bacterium]